MFGLFPPKSEVFIPKSQSITADYPTNSQNGEDIKRQLYLNSYQDTAYADYSDEVLADIYQPISILVAVHKLARFHFPAIVSVP